MRNPNLGRMLRYHRLTCNYSVQDVVDKLAKEYDIHLSTKTVYGWENGQNQPTADTLLVLCKMYQIHNILDSLGYDTTLGAEPILPNKEERELILRYRSRKEYQSAIRKLLDME